MKKTILVVDDDPGTIQILARILSASGDLIFATNGIDALQLAHQSEPDLILLDSQMPGMTGYEVCKALKSAPALGHIPVVFITSHSEPAFEVAGFEVGAADFIGKPFNAPLVLARCETQLRLKRMADDLRRIATVDSLCGIATRRSFDASLEREWQRSSRSGMPLSLLMVDIDHFKQFNDRYGHPAGDACLRAVSRALLGTSLRAADLVARYGGEEFAMILPETPRAGALHMANRVLDTIEALGIDHQASPTARHVTVSVGAACYDIDSEWWEAPKRKSRDLDDRPARCTPAILLRTADQALYLAKHAGRAQARMLDVADVDDVDTASLVRSVSTSSPHWIPGQEFGGQWTSTEWMTAGAAEINADRYGLKSTGDAQYRG